MWSRGPWRFVVVAVAAKMQQIQFVDEAVLFEQVDGAIDGDEMHAGIDFLGAGENLVDVEVLFRGVHDLQNDAALLGHADAALAPDSAEVLPVVSAVLMRSPVEARWDGEAAMVMPFRMARDTDSERWARTQLPLYARLLLTHNVRGQGRKGQEWIGSMRITSL